MRRALARPWPLSLIFALLPYGSLQAQLVPDAGALRQQIERDRSPSEPLQPPQPPQLSSPSAEPPQRPDSQEQITVNAFRFSGNTLLSGEQLLAALQPYLNRPLRFDELRAAAATVATRYRQAGWVATAYLPRQDITQGEVAITVVEAVFSGASLSGPEPEPEPKPERVAPGQVLAIAAANLKVGGPLNTAAVDRVLLLADDLPGVAVSGALSEGQADGQTGLVLTVTDEPLLSGEVFVDNQGPRSTGSDRIVLSANLNSPLGLGDRLGADGLHTQGTDYVRAAYSVPLGANGLRLGANLSQFNYRLVADEFSALQSSGTSEGAGLELSYPLIRSRLHNLGLNLAYDSRSYHNQANQAVQSHYRIEDFSLGLSASLLDRLGGGGYNTAALTLVSGQLDYGSTDAAENRALPSGFQKWRYELMRHQTLTPTLSLVASLSGQQTDKPLDSAESFYLGGPTGVRAYPVNEGAGDQGQLASLELRWLLAKGFQLSTFYDSGHTSSRNTDTRLSGYGLGLRWQSPYGAIFKATLAHRVGSNPNPTATGRDQDGSLELDRWWITLILPF